MEGKWLRAEGKNWEKDLNLKGQVGMVEIVVKDFGQGISKKDLPFIFERFYRGVSKKTEGIKGSGIGLTIVKRIVEAHGGSIVVQSEENKGTMFTVVLPVKQNSV